MASIILFLRPKVITDMPKLYSLADAMLLTLEDKEYANMTIPGKVQSYMARGKAVIASVNGASSSFIKENNLGYVCDAGDYKSLASLINNLDLDSLKEIGKHSYDIYMKEYHKDIFMKTLIDNLEKLISD